MARAGFARSPRRGRRPESRMSMLSRKGEVRSGRQLCMLSAAFVSLGSVRGSQLSLGASRSFTTGSPRTVADRRLRSEPYTQRLHCHSPTRHSIISSATSPTTPVSEKTVVLPGRDGGVRLRSPLALGAWSFGDRLFWGTTPENDSREALEASIEGGVSLVDTAEVYGFPPGRSETLLGRFLRERAPSGASTTDDTSVQLMTKFAPFPWRTAGLSADPSVAACAARWRRRSDDCNAHT
eukprot:ctg_1042.g387